MLRTDACGDCCLPALLAILSTGGALCQSTSSTFDISCDTECIVEVDGKLAGHIAGNQHLLFAVAAGSHAITAATQGGDYWEKHVDFDGRSVLPVFVSLIQAREEHAQLEAELESLRDEIRKQHLQSGCTGVSPLEVDIFSLYYHGFWRWPQKADLCISDYGIQIFQTRGEPCVPEPDSAATRKRSRREIKDRAACVPNASPREFADRVIYSAQCSDIRGVSVKTKVGDFFIQVKNEKIYLGIPYSASLDRPTFKKMRDLKARYIDEGIRRACAKGAASAR